MSAEPKSRKALLQQGVATLAGLAVATQPASAGLFGGEKQWAGVIDPRSSVKDADKLASDAVQKDITALKKYQAATKDISATLASNPQADVLPKVKATFNMSEFRSTLNGINDVFDEDTQRGTDLIVRNMLQDALELANASRMKPDVPRSERKVEILRKKLMKLDQAFVSLNAFL
eukprot:jgi/Undpi1/10691/HiC_scaffold_29.g13139.m1